MIQKIAAGYGKLLVSLLKILALVALCALFALALVLPLWKFASAAPEAYSLFVLVLLACGFVLLTARSIRRFLTAGFPTAQEKRSRASRLLKGLGKVLVILLGICGVIICILNEAAAAAWLVILAAIVIYGVLAFGTKKEKGD